MKVKDFVNGISSIFKVKQSNFCRIKSEVISLQRSFLREVLCMERI